MFWRGFLEDWKIWESEKIKIFWQVHCYFFWQGSNLQTPKNNMKGIYLDFFILFISRSKGLEVKDILTSSELCFWHCPDPRKVKKHKQSQNKFGENNLAIACFKYAFCLETWIFWRSWKMKTGGGKRCFLGLKRFLIRPFPIPEKTSHTLDPNKPFTISVSQNPHFWTA